MPTTLYVFFSHYYYAMMKLLEVLTNIAFSVSKLSAIFYRHTTVTLPPHQKKSLRVSVIVSTFHRQEAGRLTSD